MANMTKADRAEFEARKGRLGHYQRIALEQCIAYGLESKSAWLAAQREKEAAALAELNEGEKAYAAECLADGATLEDSIKAAKEAAKRLANTDKEEVKMEKIEFNTGRKYAVNGQPIVAVRFGDSVIFKDEARFIVGTFDLPAGQPLTQQAVMKAYDNYNYRMATWRKEYDTSPEPYLMAEPKPFKTVAQIEKFFRHNPTLLATFGEYQLYEHPLRGDEAPIYMATPSGTLINTGFYDLGDFAYHDLGDNNPEGLALCMEIEGDR